MAKTKSRAPASGKAPTAKKKRVKKPTYTPREVLTTVSAAIGDAFSEIQSLAEEMRETADNMESANMGHMAKCETAAAAADELENLSEPDVTSELADIAVKTTEMVNRNKRRGPSRSVRLSNAQSLLAGAVEALEAFAEKAPSGSGGETTSKQREDAEAATDLINELDDAVNAAPDFPGMYG